MEKEIHFKYLIVNEQDVSWGITVDTVGFQQIAPHEDYPPLNHPGKFLFSTDKGRIMDEYQLLYITKGEGSFISESTRQQKVREGDIFLLFPGEWHNYMPDKLTGWEIYWIGFNGFTIDTQVDNGFFSIQKPVFKVGLNNEIEELYKRAIKIAIEQKSGFQQLLAGTVNYLLGLTYSRDKNRSLDDLQVTNQINKAKIIIITHLHTGIKAEDIAAKLNMSYSGFRRIFKEYTGLAPTQYIKELKNQKEKEYLTNTSLSAKEIAVVMGYDNHEYFFTAFKKKTGMTPGQYRDFIQNTTRRRKK